jgi:hypothetical protein
MKKILILGALAALALLVSAPAHASGHACFTWSCDQSTGACSVDASCSSASPYVLYYTFNWGDGAVTGPTSTATQGHTFASGVYDSQITLTISFFSDPGYSSVTCWVWPHIYPVGPQTPSSGTCS